MKKVTKLITKNKKIQKNFRCYPEMIAKLSVTHEKLGISETEIIEAAIAFFLDCPDEIQAKFLAHYYLHLAKSLDPNQENDNQENVLRLLGDALSQIKKQNTEPQS